MKVTFKLNPAQAARAAELTAKNLKNDNPLDGGSYWAGSLTGSLTIHPALNKEQFLDYEEQTRIVSYDGHRHPLIKDGGMAALYYVVTGTHKLNPPIAAWVEELKIKSYQTSDRKLAWYETLDSFIENKGYQDAVVAHFSKKGWGRKDVNTLARFPELTEALYDLFLAKKSQAVLAATFDSKTLRQAQLLASKYVP